MLVVSTLKSIVLSCLYDYSHASSSFDGDSSIRFRSNQDPSSIPTTTTITADKFQISTPLYYFSILGFIWWFVMLLIVYYGFLEIYLKFNKPKVKPSRLSVDVDTNEILDHPDLEGVTILRPIKGIDPELETCLESCILQKYPNSKIQILFCLENSNDPSLPILNRLVSKYPNKDIQILFDDPKVSNHFGPNPKINNLAKGYKIAKFDILWVLDSNVWCNPGTLIRSVISLNNSLDNGRRTTNRPVRLVHHVPLALSISNENSYRNLGARLDEMFLFTSHAKFYVFFNKISLAPCVNGKSNLYRRSELDQSVHKISLGELPTFDKTSNAQIIQDAKLYSQTSGDGLKFFAKYIGEDNMIGIALWENGGRTGMTGDIVIQPIGDLNNDKDKNSHGVWSYIDRRVRWLRVRRFMVLAATLIEPTTESLFIGIFGTFGISNLFFKGRYKVLLLLLHEIIWCITDYSQYSMFLKFFNKDLVKQYNLEKTWETNDVYNPYFFQDVDTKLKFSKWFPIWCLRELLALPIWIIAMCGTQINWRNRPFKIRPDLSAEEL